MSSLYLFRPLRTELEARRQIKPQRPINPTATPNLPVDLAHARYLRELDRIRNAARMVPHA